MTDRRGLSTRSTPISDVRPDGLRRAPSVTVLIPTYRAARWIDATLASVAGQSRPPDEVVVVDDASPDDTVERVQAWSDRLPLVVIRNETNLGIGLNRARGVAAASGDLIALLDHDDVWLPDHLETVVPLAADGRTIVASRALRWLPGTAVVPERNEFPPEELLRDGLLSQNYMATGSVYPRAAFAALDRPSSSGSVDDWETWIRLVFEQGCRVAVSPTATILYRSSQSQTSAGDGCLPGEIELLERLLAEPRYQPHRQTLEATLARRRLRAQLVEAMALAADGHHADARRRFLSVAVRDRSLRGLTKPTGSLMLRAAVGVVSPRLFLERRSRHLTSNAVAAPAAAPAPAAAAPATPTAPTAPAAPIAAGSANEPLVTFLEPPHDHPEASCSSSAMTT